MKTTCLLVSGWLIAAAFSTQAMTIAVEMTPAGVREHPKEFSVEVTKGDDGLIHFTIKHDVSRPMYHVAHLEIRHQGKLIAESSTPSFGREYGNAFSALSFSIAPEYVVESKFDLSDHALSDDGELPVVGGTMYKFRLVDFVPKELLEPAAGK